MTNLQLTFYNLSMFFLCTVALLITIGRIDVKRYYHLINKDYAHYLNHVRKQSTGSLHIEGPSSQALIDKLTRHHYFANNISEVTLLCFVSAIWINPSSPQSTLLIASTVLYLASRAIEAKHLANPVHPDRKLSKPWLAGEIIIDILMYALIIFMMIGTIGNLIIIHHFM